MRIITAKNFWQRSLGLLGRRELGRDLGFLIPRCRWVHTAFMKFAIDVIFVDKAGRVLRVDENLRPWGVSSRVPKAFAAIEVDAGEALRQGIRVGKETSFS